MTLRSIEQWKRRRQARLGRPSGCGPGPVPPAVAAPSGVAVIDSDLGAGRYTVTEQWYDPDAAGGAGAWQDAVEPGGLLAVAARDIRSRSGASVGDRVLFHAQPTADGEIELAIDIGGGGGGASIQWAVASADWTRPAGEVPSVACHPCADADGASPDTSVDLDVLLPAPAGRDPNVRTGQVIATCSTGAGMVCVSDYLDDAIGTVKMWAGALADIPAGWQLHATLAGRFPVGYDAGDADYDAIGDTGGTASHDHNGFTGLRNPDETDSYGYGCTPFYHFHEAHSHAIATDDHRPPYAVIAFIRRVD